MLRVTSLKNSTDVVLCRMTSEGFLGIVIAPTARLHVASGTFSTQAIQQMFFSTGSATLTLTSNASTNVCAILIALCGVKDVLQLVAIAE